MFSKVFVRFARVALVAALVQLSLISLPSAQTVSPRTAKEVQILDKQVNEFAKAGKYAEAIPLQQRVLAILEKVLGPDDANVATALKNLAILYRVQGRYADAEPLFKRSLAIREKALGPDHPLVAESLGNLAYAVPVPGPLCGGRAAAQAVAGDPGEGAGSRPSRVAEA